MYISTDVVCVVSGSVLSLFPHSTTGVFVLLVRIDGKPIGFASPSIDGGKGPWIGGHPSWTTFPEGTEGEPILTVHPRSFSKGCPLSHTCAQGLDRHPRRAAFVPVEDQNHVQATMRGATRATTLHRTTRSTRRRNEKDANRTCGRNVTAYVAHAAPLPAQEKVEDRLQALVCEVEGTNRGIFGVKAAKAEAIEEIAREVEELGSTLSGRPVDHVEGSWRVLYSTIAIMGSKRTKLGLRGFLQLSDIYQDIDTQNKKASNRITFRAPGLNGSVGALTLTASYAELSDTKVQVDLVDAALEPQQLKAIFEQNYEMLLEVFNPTGWLSITYVDENFRIGRDDKGNLFILEKC